MPGFTVNNMGLRPVLHNLYEDLCLSGEMNCPPYHIARKVVNKFIDDKLFYEDEDVILVTDGVIYNRLELTAEYGAKDFAQAVKAMALADRGGFFARFRGSFCGAAYFRDADEWYIYTNHTGERPVLYYHDGERFFAGTQPNYLLDALRGAGVKLELDEKAVLDMLSFAYMERDNTYARQIKRLGPGTALHVAPGVFEVLSYYRLRRDGFDPAGMSYDEIIDELDRRFRAAVNYEYGKDREYGYAHWANITGGLDARMSNWVARDMGFGPVLNTESGQSGCLDEKIGRKLSRSMGNPIAVMASDDAGFMLDLDEEVRAGYGFGSYSMQSKNLDTNRVFDWRYFGLAHTGKLGGMIVGCHCSSIAEVNDPGIGGNRSRKLKHLIQPDYRATFADKELYIFTVLGLQFGSASASVNQHHSESVTPFGNPDLIDFCLSLPVEYRLRHKLYKDWILRKYPGAARFKWEKTNSKITMPWRLGRLKMLAVHYPAIALNVLGHGINSGAAPHNYWYRTQPRIRQFFDEYFASHIGHPMLTEELRGHVRFLFENGYTDEKEQALTALAAVHYYFPI